MIRSLALVLALSQPVAAMDTFTFDSIDGGTISSADWAGKPVLVVNTASLCGYTPQYADLQELHERYREQGLVVLAVPSDDFRQELASEGEVKDFCELTFGLDMPMTVISHVRGADAVPFYKWLAREHDFVPRWNFNKVLISPDGEVAETFGSGTKPTDPRITSRIEAMLR